MPKRNRRRVLWRRVLAHPLISAELAFVTVVVAIAAMLLSPVGERISLMIATHENTAVVAGLVVAVGLLAALTLIGVAMLALQALGRPRRTKH